MKNRFFKTMAAIIVSVILVGAYFLIQHNIAAAKSKEAAKNYSDVIALLKEDKIQSFTLNVTTGKMQYVLRGDTSNKHTITIASPTFFHDDIKDIVADKTIEMNYKAGNAGGKIISFLPNILWIVVIIFLFSRLSEMMPGQGGKDHGGQHAINKTTSKKLFKDVAGADEEKAELEEVVEFLKNPDKFTKMGAHIPRGILLVGPPGTGKTLLAKAVAGEAGVPFFSMCGSDFMEMYVGVGASRVRSLFEKAKKQAPSIIFIDEIDAIGSRRKSNTGGGNDEQERTLNQLLVEMDGFGENQGVIVIAATNRPDMLDKALLRPGRFDRQVVVSVPDVAGREAILKIHAAGKVFAKEVDIQAIAQDTVGFSGAELENLLNEAALMAVRNKHAVITNQDIESAMLKVIVGTEKKSSVISANDKQITAYHEAGHAIVSYCMKHADPVQQISIIPRGMAGGFTMYRQQNDRSYLSKEEIQEKIAELLGGRAAEELTQASITSGASNDLDRATDFAKQMVTRYGMSSEVGLMTCKLDEEGRYIGVSDKLKEKIDQEVQDILQERYSCARSILEQKRAYLEKVAAALLSREKISGEEFRNIMEA